MISLTPLYVSIAKSHPYGSYTFQTYSVNNPLDYSTKRKNKDAFYGNAKTNIDRQSIDSAHKARLATKSNQGFPTDFGLAVQDLFNRICSRYFLQVSKRIQITE